MKIGLLLSLLSVQYKLSNAKYISTGYDDAIILKYAAFKSEIAFSLFFVV